jgi:hypothetical protein
LLRDRHRMRFLESHDGPSLETCNRPVRWTPGFDAPWWRATQRESTRSVRKGCVWAMLALTATVGCSALYPELRTSLREVGDDEVVKGPPPRQMAYIQFVRARIPPRAPDGRPWDESDDELPDPVARLIVDGKTLLQTPIEEDTLEPTWPTQRRTNYVVKPGSVAVVELMDHDAISDRPICIKQIGDIRSEGLLGNVEVMCDGGTRIWLSVQPARPKMGLGLFYELRVGQVLVSRVAPHSPAGRAGLRVGDEFIELEGQPARKMDEAQVRSVFNAGAHNGLHVTVQSPGGAPRDVVLKEGAVYITEDDAEAWGVDVTFEE